MRFAWTIGIALGVLGAGCGSKSDPSERNFAKAIEAFLARSDGLCLGIRQWPVNIPEYAMRKSLFSPGGPPRTLVALESVGLARSEDVDVDSERTGFDLKPMRVKEKARRYSLTEAARPYVHETPDKRQVLCWGRAVLDKVVKWEGPLKFGEYQEARVAYHFKIDGQAAWALKPEIQEAFSSVSAALGAASRSEQLVQVKLTNLGWEVYDRVGLPKAWD